MILGLTLSGVASGFSAPASAGMVAGAVDPDDLGIANGMSQQVQYIGIVAGIQTMLVLVGDNPSTAAVRPDVPVRRGGGGHRPAGRGGARATRVRRRRRVAGGVAEVRCRGASARLRWDFDRCVKNRTPSGL